MSGKTKSYLGMIGLGGVLFTENQLSDEDRDLPLEEEDELLDDDELLDLDALLDEDELLDTVLLDRLYCSSP